MGRGEWVVDGRRRLSRNSHQGHPLRDRVPRLRRSSAGRGAFLLLALRNAVADVAEKPGLNRISHHHGTCRDSVPLLGTSSARRKVMPMNRLFPGPCAAWSRHTLVKDLG